MSPGQTGALQTGHRGSWSTASAMQPRWYGCPQGSVTPPSPRSTSSRHTVHIGAGGGAGCGGGALRLRLHHHLDARLARQMSSSVAVRAQSRTTENFHRQPEPRARTIPLSSRSSSERVSSPPISCVHRTAIRSTFALLANLEFLYSYQTLKKHKHFLANVSELVFH